MKAKRNVIRLHAGSQAVQSAPFLLLLIAALACCTLMIPANLFADGISTPGSTIPPEQWEKEPPMKKAPLPSQIYGLKPSPEKVLHLPPIDVDKLIEEDKRTGNFGKPVRDAIAREVNISPLTHGEWFDFDGKGSIWLLEIHVPTASGIDVQFTDVYLPEGARIYVYSPSKPDRYAGPYRGGPELWAGTIIDDKIIIELAIPVPYDHTKPPFIIKKIGHMYVPIRKTTFEYVDDPVAATCHNDATCYPDWAIEGDAVGRIYYRKGGLPYLCRKLFLLKV
ncbi:MAG: hypothetical protein FJ241_12855, partial [Nitrospira sp.]|nr:hypothetical protein [Nitrospira sp.]